jgi:hypothetical protein
MYNAHDIHLYAREGYFFPAFGKSALIKTFRNQT